MDTAARPAVVATAPAPAVPTQVGSRVVQPRELETYEAVERAYGRLWADRFLVVAPVVLADATGPLARAFEEGLLAHGAGARYAAAEAWAICQSLLHELRGPVADGPPPFLVAR